VTVVVRGGFVIDRPADVVIAGERIVDIVAPGTAETVGAEVIDAGGLAVLPGMVDGHVHFDEPGRSDWEGFDAGSAAAAAGGVTTIVDMPIDSDPPTTTAALAEAKADAARARSRVDVALWGGLVPGSVDHLDDLAAVGVVGFKAFACPSGWDDFPAIDEPTLVAGFAAARRHGLPLALHAELEPLGHTAESEVAAIGWAASRADGARLHVVHVSAAAAVDEARRWPNVTVETCPHYLALTTTADPHARCTPPIRDAANQEALWRHVLDGAVDAIASDHSPCPPERRGEWAGVAGVETTLAVLLSSGRMTLAQVAHLTTAAARLLRLPGKGAIVRGYDADIALVDLDAAWTVSPDALWCRHRSSPFIGRQLGARVVRTLVRGSTVFDLADGPRPHQGRVLRARSAGRP